jgi:hypothetical protein
VAIADSSLIAHITREEFRRIHRYCADHDAERSRDSADIYDAPSGTVAISTPIASGATKRWGPGGPRANLIC